MSLSHEHCAGPSVLRVVVRVRTLTYRAKKLKSYKKLRRRTSTPTRSPLLRFSFFTWSIAHSVASSEGVLQSSIDRFPSTAVTAPLVMCSTKQRNLPSVGRNPKDIHVQRRLSKARLMTLQYYLSDRLFTYLCRYGRRRSLSLEAGWHNSPLEDLGPAVVAGAALVGVRTDSGGVSVPPRLVPLRLFLSRGRRRTPHQIECVPRLRPGRAASSGRRPHARIGRGGHSSVFLARPCSASVPTIGNPTIVNNC